MSSILTKEKFFEHLRSRSAGMREEVEDEVVEKNRKTKKSEKKTKTTKKQPVEEPVSSENEETPYIHTEQKPQYKITNSDVFF